MVWFLHCNYCMAGISPLPPPSPQRAISIASKNISARPTHRPLELHSEWSSREGEREQIEQNNNNQINLKQMENDDDEMDGTDGANENVISISNARCMSAEGIGARNSLQFIMMSVRWIYRFRTTNATQYATTCIAFITYFTAVNSIRLRFNSRKFVWMRGWSSAVSASFFVRCSFVRFDWCHFNFHLFFLFFSFSRQLRGHNYSLLWRNTKNMVDTHETRTIRATKLIIISLIVWEFMSVCSIVQPAEATFTIYSRDRDQWMDWRIYSRNFDQNK